MRSQVLTLILLLGLCHAVRYTHTSGPLTFLLLSREPIPNHRKSEVDAVTNQSNYAPIGKRRQRSCNLIRISDLKCPRVLSVVVKPPQIDLSDEMDKTYPSGGLMAFSLHALVAPSICRRGRRPTAGPNRTCKSAPHYSQKARSG